MEFPKGFMTILHPRQKGRKLTTARTIDHILAFAMGIGHRRLGDDMVRVADSQCMTALTMAHSHDQNLVVICCLPKSLWVASFYEGPCLVVLKANRRPKEVPPKKRDHPQRKGGDLNCPLLFISPGVPFRFPNPPPTPQNTAGSKKLAQSVSFPLCSNQKEKKGETCCFTQMHHLCPHRPNSALRKPVIEHAFQCTMQGHEEGAH